jgi:hypothetical protein
VKQGAKKPRAPEDWIVALPCPREQITDAANFRSTWLTASQATLRARGYGEAYEAAIDPKYREAVLGAVAGVWLPMAVGRAHYIACDALKLSTTELLDIGIAATKRANPTTLSMIRRLAQGAGATPWTVLALSRRIWSAAVDGGAVAVARLGPKEAQIEIVGFPLASIRYNRITTRGIVSAVLELFCKKAYVQEIGALCDDTSIGMRASWA